MKLPEKIEPIEVYHGKTNEDYQFTGTSIKLLSQADTAINALIDYLKEREEVEDRRYKEIDNRFQTIANNQLEMKRGDRMITVTVPTDTPKRWPEIGDIVYCFNSQGQILEQRWNNTKKQNGKKDFMGIFATREEAQAYKEKLLEMGRNSN